VPTPSVYTAALTTEQAATLRDLLAESGFDFPKQPPYTLYQGRKGKLVVTVYEKGPKAVVQGKGWEEFVEFTLEPQVLGEARRGYEAVRNPEMFAPHFGIDESGKGDFFGPLAIAGVHVDEKLAQHFLDAGIADSKRITSDARIRTLAAAIRKSGAAHTLVLIPPPRYNALIKQIGNLNRLLAWGHARAIENLCELRSDCPRALSDKFADVRVLRSALMARGRTLHLDQQTKAESDYAVAAASILAREAFIDWMDDASKKCGVTLAKGVSTATKAAARAIFERDGREALAAVAKEHFKTFTEITNELL